MGKTQSSLKFVLVNKEVIYIPLRILKHFGLFDSLYQEKRYEEFNELREQRLYKWLWKDIISALTTYEDSNRRMATLPLSLDSLGLQSLYKLLRVADYYDVHLLIGFTLEQIMRRLLSMSAIELYEAHDKVVRDTNASYDEIIDDVLLNYIEVASLIELIHTRFIPRAGPQIAAGLHSSIVITTKGVYGAGRNDNGRTGVSQYLPDGGNFRRTRLENVIAVWASGATSFFLTRDGSLYSAGMVSNILGRDMTNTFTGGRPQKIDIPFIVLTMVCGEDRALALTSNGLYMWGQFARSPYRLRLETQLDVKTLGIGKCYVAIVTTSDELYLETEYCFVVDHEEGTDLRFTPKKVDLPLGVVKMHCSDQRILVILRDGMIYEIVLKQQQTSIAVMPPKLFTTVFKAGDVTDLYGYGKELFFWVPRNNGLYLAKKEDTREWPDLILEIPSDVIVKEVSCGHEHTLILTSDGLLYGIGSNEYKALGLPIYEGQTWHIKNATLLPINVYPDQQSLDKKKAKDTICIISCHMCGNTSPLFVHYKSGKLFCHDSCFSAYHAPIGKEQ